MMRFVLAALVAVLIGGLAACTTAADVQNEFPTPMGPVAGSTEVTTGVTLSITIPARELLAGTTASATVAVENASGTTATVFDIVGLRIRQEGGGTVYDSLAGLRLLSGQRELAAGESRVNHIFLLVPQAHGLYFLDAYLYGSGTPSEGETSATVRFTAVGE